MTTIIGPAAGAASLSAPTDHAAVSGVSWGPIIAGSAAAAGAFRASLAALSGGRWRDAWFIA